MKSTRVQKDVVVIGGGGAGLAALKAMLKEGYKEICLLDKNSDIGGVWLTTQYPGLRIHTAAWAYRYFDFYAPKSESVHATREEIHRYFYEYAQSHRLYDYMQFNTIVSRIIYKKMSADKKCEVRAVNTLTQEEIIIECDYVICALGFTHAGNPNLPHFPGEEDFKGVIAHSSQFNQEMFNDIVENKKRVVVLGAGKSGQDILWSLKNYNLNNITWLYKKSLWSRAFESYFVKKKSDNFFINNYLVIVMLLRAKLKKFNWLMRMLELPIIWRGLFINPIETKSDIFNSRYAILTRDQFEFLKSPSFKKINGQIKSLQDNKITLVNNETIDTDYLICATGYDRTGNIPEIIIMDENNNMTIYDPSMQYSFFRHMIDPSIPNISLFTADGLFPSQIFGFSIAAEWLARFYKNKLIKKYSSEDMQKELDSYKKRHPSWLTERNAVPYFFNYDLPVFMNVLSDLGFSKLFALKILTDYRYGEKYFNEMCQKLVDGLEDR